VPENAVPASATQALNWCVHAAEAADGRSMNTSSRTMNSRVWELGFGRTPGGEPPRERVKMKKVTTSMIIVVVFVVVAAREVMVGFVEAVSAVVRSLVGREVARAVVESALVEFVPAARVAVPRFLVEFVATARVAVARALVEFVTNASCVVDKACVVEFATTLAAKEVVEAFVAKAVVEALPVVELAGSEITQEVAAPFPSTWQTTGWKAAGGHVSCVKDIRYLSHRKVNRLLPTVAAGVVCVMNTLWKPLKNGGAMVTMFWQYGARAPEFAPAATTGWLTPRRYWFVFWVLTVPLAVRRVSGSLRGTRPIGACCNVLA
jgi:hypothetical protein